MYFWWINLLKVVLEAKYIVYFTGIYNYFIYWKQKLNVESLKLIIA